MLLWSFAQEMWEHQNDVLQDTQLEDSCQMRDAEILMIPLPSCTKRWTCNVQRIDAWYFDVPLAIRLLKPLRSHHQLLVNARILVDKSEQHAMSGQHTLNQYYTHLPSMRTFQNAALEWIGSGCQTEFPNEPVESVEFLYTRTQLKIRSCLL
jgi:hypothetical protein